MKPIKHKHTPWYYAILFFAGGIVFTLVLNLGYTWLRKTSLVNCQLQKIPIAAYRTIAYIQVHGHPPHSFHSEKFRGKFDGMQVMECDIYPHVKHIYRGRRRLLYNYKLNKYYYTSDHYKHYTEITSACMKHFTDSSYYD